MEFEIIEQEAKARTMALLLEVNAIQIVDQPSYTAANEIADRAARALKRIDESCDPVIEAAHKAHKVAIDQKKKLREPIELIKKNIEQKMITWYRAEQARAAEEKRKAEEAARKQAEEEALKTAQILQDMGMNEAAEEAISQPIVTPKITVAEPEKASGESYRETWSAEVVDLISLVKAVAAGTQPLAYLEANITALNGAARTFKGTVQIPGVKIMASTILARRMS